MSPVDSEGKIAANGVQILNKFGCASAMKVNFIAFGLYKF